MTSCMKHYKTVVINNRNSIKNIFFIYSEWNGEVSVVEWQRRNCLTKSLIIYASILPGSVIKDLIAAQI